MARKSGWQEFTENFNGVYGAFTKVAQDFETGKIMNDEKFTAEGKGGAGLSGGALEKARYKALGDIYTKYGNAKEGLAVRGQLADLESKDRENTINQSIMQELIAQRGTLQSGLMRGQTASANASAASGYASARNSDSIRGERNALLPGRLTNQSLTNDRAVTQNDLTESQAVLAQIKAENAVATQDSDQDATESQNAVSIAQDTLGINTAEAALANATTEDLILSRVMSASYETAPEADAAAIAAIQQSNISFERKATLISTIQKMGLGKLANEGATFTQQGLNALGKGLDAGIKWYDGVDDGNTLAIKRGKDGSVRVMETRGDAVRELFSATGDTAEQQIIAQLATQIQQPSKALAVAASVADLAQTRANTEKTGVSTQLINAQVFTELMQTDVIGARNALVKAQTDRVLQEIDAAKAGLGKSQEIAQRGLAQLQSSEAFAYMGDGEGGRNLQLDAIGDYMRVMRMQGAPPAGVAGSLWMSLNDEEKAEFK